MAQLDTSGFKKFFSVQTEGGAAESATPAEISARKKRVILSAAGVVLLMIGIIFGVAKLTEKNLGPPHFGICKIFTELNIQFPSEAKNVYVDGFGETLRLGYRTIDSFGSFRLDSISCTFREDPELGLVLNTYSINRREFSKEEIEKFNRSLKYFDDFNVDLEMPDGLPDDIEKLYRTY